MEIITVSLGIKTYNIEIASGSFDAIGAKTRKLSSAEKVVIISDSNVDQIYGERLEQTLCQQGFIVERVVVEAGEKSKTIAVLTHIYERLSLSGLTRSDLIITLGGGVVGDLGGFAAATFMRGIDFIQVPTSLLAQIDSSVGGKVAVDLPAGKNLVGSFYQPKAVFIDPEVLNTLPVKFLHDGLAEAIKYGALADVELFDWLNEYKNEAELLLNSEKIIARCCQIKARIVEKDEFDTGLRMLLNFGHTIGHAIEKHYGFEKYTHGEAVGIGMLQLTRKTEAMGFTAPGSSAKLEKLLIKFSLPLVASISDEELLRAIKMDKKKSGDNITLILLDKIGKSTLKKVQWQDLLKYVGGNER